MSKPPEKTAKEIISEHMRKQGAKGGSAGVGAAKARTSEQARAAALARDYAKKPTKAHKIPAEK